MSEPTGTRPFATFEWMLSLRYLRARRKRRIHLGHRRLSRFSAFMLGVATLIIVMAVMNGFRKELLDKILGLNGHLLMQPLDAPLTDYAAVAERICKRAGHQAGRADCRRPGAGVVAVQCFRCAGARHARRELTKLGSIAKNIKQGTLEGFRRRAGRADRPAACGSTDACARAIP